MDEGLLNNLDSCRIGLMNWDRNGFGQVKKRIRELREELEKSQLQPFTAAVKRRSSDLKKELEECLDREEIMWKQRSKTQWLAEGYRNTRFFHSQASHRAKINEISGLENELGKFCEDEI